MLYSSAVPSTREGNSPVQVPLGAVQLAMLALHLGVRKDGPLPANPTEYFNFVVDNLT